MKFWEKIGTHTADENLTEPVKGDVEFRNVSFSYPSRKETKLFTDLTFRVQAGQKIALVGSQSAPASLPLSKCFPVYIL
jgi:ABC-type multidrug transport system fused ATPase/permease subunit